MEDQDSGRNDYVSTTGSNKEPTPTLREAKAVIQQLKINKSVGKAAIDAKLNKMDPKKLVMYRIG